MKSASFVGQPNYPILFFSMFHRSMNSQVDDLHRLVMSHFSGEKNVGIDIQSSFEKYRFLGLVYEQHLNAKDEVIFSALNARKNNLVGQRDISDQILETLKSSTLRIYEIRCTEDLLSSTKALKQLITENMAKEEVQVIPMLLGNFSIEDQASLVWQYLCEMPAYLLVKLLSFMSSTLSAHEYQDLLDLLSKIDPKEKILQQAIFEWIERKESLESENSKSTTSPIENIELHPIDDTLLWHKAIKKELNETFEKIKRMYLSGDFQSREFDERLNFITEVCLFQSIARDKVTFPSVFGEASSSFNQHDEQQRKFNKFRDFIRNSKEESYSSAEFYSKLCSFVDQVMGTIGRHLYIEESRVLPLAREKFSIERQRALLHQSLSMMPLRLTQRVLPWLARTLSDEEAKTFLNNLQSAGPASDSGLVKLFRKWARNVESRVISNGVLVSCGIEQPIDIMFKVHKAVRRDLEHLSSESKRISDGDEAFLHQFIGKFCLLWGLYKSHSNSEDNIIHPALESRVDSSYALDHERDERLFEEIFRLLSELSRLHQRGFDAGKYHELSTKLEVMCDSMRVSIDQHSLREETQLWPLLRTVFSVEEQEKMIGYILGTTSAEVLRVLLPWLSSSLDHDEQRKMMEIFKRVTKNTMFEEWLEDCSKENLLAVSRKVFGSDSVQNLVVRGDLIFRPRKNDQKKDVCPGLTSSPTRNKKLLQKYMANRWMAAQKRLPRTRQSLIGRSASFRDHKERVFGCEHYKRNCKLRADCCGELFPCRLCHDSISDHSMDRKSTSEMMCMRCLEIQPIGQTCNTPSCNGLPMAKYHCNICKLFDDERKIYHCPYCNICRVGSGLGVDYFHCMSCNCCMSIKLLDHTCKPKCLETSCPVCDEFLFTSVKPVKALPCGSCIHLTCFQEVDSNPCKCLICTQTSGDTMALAKSSSVVVELGDHWKMKPYYHIKNGRRTEVPSWPDDHTSEKTAAFRLENFWEERVYPFLVWLRSSSFNDRRARRMMIRKEGSRRAEGVFLCCFALFSLVVFCVMSSLAVLLCLKLVGRDSYGFSW